MASAQVAGDTDRIDRDVTAPAGELVHLVGDVAPVGEHRVLGAQAPRQVKRSRGAVDRDHPGPGGNRDLHGAEPDAADSDHRHPLAAPDAGPRIQRAVSGGEPAAQSRRRRVADDVGDRDQVGVGGMQGHVLGEGTPVRETGLGLIGTHLCLTVLAPLAPPAAAHERRRHPVADRPPSHLGADRDDDADQLVTGNVRKCYPVVMAGPCVPVTTAETGRVHLDDHAAGRRRRIGDRPDVHRTTELFEHRRTHEAILRHSLAWRPCARSRSRWMRRRSPR